MAYNICLSEYNATLTGGYLGRGTIHSNNGVPFKDSNKYHFWRNDDGLTDIRGEYYLDEYNDRHSFTASPMKGSYFQKLPIEGTNK